MIFFCCTSPTIYHIKYPLYYRRWAARKVHFSAKVRKNLKSIDAAGYVTFTEPYPENMRNSWNSYFPFQAKVLSGKDATLNFRYTDQAYGNMSDYSSADLVVVVLGQSLSHEFLNKELGTSNGKTYYGKTGLSFNANNPKICGSTLMVSGVSQSNVSFTEPYPENMRNAWNSYFPFDVKIIAG